MANSVVSICNLALGKLGAQPILALTEDSDNARACNRVFDQCRDLLLRKHPWNFAVNRATLAMLSTPPAYGYERAFQLPSAPYCLRVLELMEERTTGADWKIEGRSLVTDAPTARIKYIARVTDPTQYDPEFVMALALLLAAEVAIPITSETSIAKSMFELYQAAVGDAVGSDAREGYAPGDDQPIEEPGSWLSSR